MALGMLLPSSLDNQKELAGNAPVVRCLLAMTQQNDDDDIKAISRDLLAGLVGC